MIARRKQPELSESLLRLAYLHRKLAWGLLGGCGCALLNRLSGGTLEWPDAHSYTLLALVLGNIAYLAITVFQIARSHHSATLGIVIAGALLFPPTALLVLLCLDFRLSSLLWSNGYHVGWLGVSTTELEAMSSSVGLSSDR